MSTFIFDFAAEKPKASTPRTGSPIVRGRFAQKQNSRRIGLLDQDTPAVDPDQAATRTTLCESWRVLSWISALMPESRQKSVNLARYRDDAPASCDNFQPPGCPPPHHSCRADVMSATFMPPPDGEAALRR